MILNEEHRDLISEIVNIGVGKGSASLSKMLNERVILTVPYVNILKFDELRPEFQKFSDHEVDVVELEFKGIFEGLANIIVPCNSARELTSVILKMEDQAEVEAVRESVMVEIGNIILNAVMGAFGNLFNQSLDYNIPKSYQGDVNSIFQNLDSAKFNEVLLCKTNFEVDSRNIRGEIVIMYEISSLNKLKDSLNAVIEEN